MSHSSESSAKRYLPVLLGVSILGGGLLSIAVALQTHGKSSESVPAAAVSTAQTTAPAAIVSPAAQAAPSNSNKPAQAGTSTAPAPSGQSVAQTSRQTLDSFQTSDLPATGIVKEMVAGDLMCYLTVQDDQGVTRRVGATFEVCQQTGLLNQRVQFSYEPVSVNDCDSSEPCGKSRSLLLVSRMEPIQNSSADRTTDRTASQSSDRYTITNGEWTITVSNLQSWSGVNNTGNMDYYGCNSQNECLRLQGGRMSCRDGICAIGWQNGDYLYSLESPMGTEANAAQQTAATLLTVRQGDTVILRASGFREVNN